MGAEYYLDKRYGSLVVKRVLDDGRLFCICEPKNGRVCGRTREVKPSELSSVKQCRFCSQLWRQGKSDKAHILPPKIEPIREIPKPVCKGCRPAEPGKVWARPDCPVHWISTSYERNAEKVVYSEGI